MIEATRLYGIAPRLRWLVLLVLLGLVGWAGAAVNVELDRSRLANVSWRPTRRALAPESADVLPRRGHRHFSSILKRNDSENNCYQHDNEKKEFHETPP